MNVDKTKSMLFHKRRPVTPIQFSMNNRIIDVVQYFNYLGIMLDADMSWKTHVAMVRNKLSRINGILHRLKYIYPQNVLTLSRPQVSAISQKKYYTWIIILILTIEL